MILPGVRTYFAGLLIVSFLILFGVETRAETAGEQEIVILFAASEDQARFDRIAESMEAQFAGSEVVFVVHWVEEVPGRLPEQEQLAAKVASNTGALAVLWVDLTISERVYFYLSTANSNKVVVRRLDGTGEEGLADALALICRSAVDSVLEGVTVETDPSINLEAEREAEKAPESESEEVTQEEPHFDENEEKDRPVHLFVDAAYSLSFLSDTGRVQNGAYFSFATVFGERLRIFAGYTVLQSIEDSNSHATLELKRHPIHLGAAVSFRTGRWSIECGARLVLDYMTRNPVSQSTNASVEGSYEKLGVSVIPAVRIDLNVVGSLSLFLSAGAEIHFTKYDWSFEGDSGFFDDLWRVRPELLLGGNFSFY